MGRNLVAFLLFFITISSFSQEFSRKDSLRGNLTPIRTCYDVTFYDLKVMIDEKEKSIERSYNIIHFTVVENFEWFQIDLASNMEVQIIEFEKSQLEFSREFDAVYVYFNREVKKGEQLSIKVWYGGYPREAVNAPWDGGFSWKKD